MVTKLPPCLNKVVSLHSRLLLSSALLCRQTKPPHEAHRSRPCHRLRKIPRSLDQSSELEYLHDGESANIKWCVSRKAVDKIN